MNIKQLFSALLFFLSIGVVISCEEDEDLVPVGEDWIKVDTKIYFIDSMTVESSTFKFDSISVSNTSRLLVGSYTDPVFGKVKAKSFMQLAYPFSSISDDAVYDSIALVLNYDNYYYNDTTQTQSIEVFNVLDDIKTDDGYFYNTTTFDVSETSIGSRTFTPYPTKEDSIHVRISDVFGEELYEKIRDNEITTSDEFLNQYQGILVSPDENNTSVLGFSTTSSLRLYYSYDDETEAEESEIIEFSLNSTNSFHNIATDYSGTYFDTLESEETQIASTDTDDNVFTQSGTGLATRIDIPFVERINDIAGTGSILDANLKISIKQNSSTENLFTRDSLSVYLIDRKGDVYGVLTDTSSETVYAVLEDSDEEFETLTYFIPVTYFLNLKLDATYKDNLYLAIYGQDFNQSVDRYILNGEETPSDDLKLKLELTYAIYED
ncbi:DUF4270 family protein [Algibacter sp. L4_22]|uniref:DUF4270 family protein n=1 Tax=Algibacter sp. L4_22 TaxID=2942477 RepID=UPI00201B7640|nr:DUF4270 family protein [Algibacter sp. L4_22]MCL5127616.1 DUF4270 domain-containing protein [Algibacter sp. L4_22]